MTDLEERVRDALQARAMEIAEVARTFHAGLPRRGGQGGRRPGRARKSLIGTSRRAAPPSPWPSRGGDAEHAFVRESTGCDFGVKG